MKTFQGAMVLFGISGLLMLTVESFVLGAHNGRLTTLEINLDKASRSVSRLEAASLATISANQGKP